MRTSPKLSNLRRVIEETLKCTTLDRSEKLTYLLGMRSLAYITNGPVSSIYDCIKEYIDKFDDLMRGEVVGYNVCRDETLIKRFDIDELKQAEDFMNEFPVLQHQTVYIDKVFSDGSVETIDNKKGIQA